MNQKYNPNAWFQWREFMTCAVQVVFIVSAIIAILGVALYLLLVR